MHFYLRTHDLLWCWGAGAKEACNITSVFNIHTAELNKAWNPVSVSDKEDTDSGCYTGSRRGEELEAFKR